MYRSFHLNFSSPIGRELLEDLAAKSVRIDSVPLISSVFDHYLDFISLEHNLFSFTDKTSLSTCYNLQITDSEAEAQVQIISERLFAVLVTLVSFPPYFRIPSPFLAPFLRFFIISNGKSEYFFYF